MKKTALTFFSLVIALCSVTAHAQTVYYVDRVIGPGNVTGTITVRDEAIPGQIGPDDIISWSFEGFDGTDTVSISSATGGFLLGTAWNYLSASPTALTFDFDGALADPDPSVEGIAFVDEDAQVPETSSYNLLGNFLGKIEQVVHQFGFEPNNGGHVANSQPREGIVVIGTSDPVSTTRAELPRRFEALDLSSIVNTDLVTGSVFGDLFPGPGPTPFGNTPFIITDGGNGNAWMVAEPNIFAVAPVDFSITGLSIEGPDKMYAQINSAFGFCGFNVGSIGVSGISSVAFPLIEGKNVRDWLEGPFCGSQTDAIYTATYDFLGRDGVPPGEARFDVYEFDLSGLSGPIDTFEFRIAGNVSPFEGSPFLTAVTFEFKGYDYELLDYPGLPTRLWGISEKGDVVGTGGAGPDNYSFVYSSTRGSFQDVPAPSGFLNAGVLDIASNGVMVGSVQNLDVVTSSGFIRDKDGNFTFFDHPDTDIGAVCRTLPRGVNANGLVSGYIRYCESGKGTSGFIYDSKNGTFIDIVPSQMFTLAHGINAKGDVVGNSFFSEDEDPCNSSGSNGYGWLRMADGSVTYFQVNGQQTNARGINDEGFIVGSFVDANSQTRKGFRVRLSGDSACESVTVDADNMLDFPGYQHTIPEGISNSDVVVGIVTDESGNHGFIARPK